MRESELGIDADGKAVHSHGSSSILTETENSEATERPLRVEPELEFDRLDRDIQLE